MRWGARRPRIILEPQGKNTAPALTLAALALDATGSDGVMLVMPADHYIQDLEAFHQAVRQGARLAEAGNIVTFGIVPTSPEIGFGYIKTGTPLNSADGTQTGYHIAAFTEKPGAEEARAFLATGQYLWNSGMFMMTRFGLARSGAKTLSADLHPLPQRVSGRQAGKRLLLIGDEHFSACPSDSIDYAVMERVEAGRFADTDHVRSRWNWMACGPMSVRGMHFGRSAIRTVTAT